MSASQSSVNQMTVGLMDFDQMSVGQSSVYQMFVSLMFFDQMSVGLMFFDRMTRNSTCLGTSTLLVRSSCVSPTWGWSLSSPIREIRRRWRRDSSEDPTKGDRRFPGIATAGRWNYPDRRRGAQNWEPRKREASGSSKVAGNLVTYTIKI